MKKTDLNDKEASDAIRTFFGCELIEKFNSIQFVIFINNHQHRLTIRKTRSLETN